MNYGNDNKNTIIEDWKDKIKDEGLFGGPKDFGPSSEGPTNKQFEDIA